MYIPLPDSYIGGGTGGGRVGEEGEGGLALWSGAGAPTTFAWEAVPPQNLYNDVIIMAGVLQTKFKATWDCEFLVPGPDVKRTLLCSL